MCGPRDSRASQRASAGPRRARAGAAALRPARCRSRRATNPADPAPQSGDRFITARALENLWEQHRFVRSSRHSSLRHASERSRDKRTRRYSVARRRHHSSRNEAAALCRRARHRASACRPAVDRPGPRRGTTERASHLLGTAARRHAATRSRQRPRASVTELDFRSGCDRRRPATCSICRSLAFVSDAAPEPARALPG